MVQNDIKWPKWTQNGLKYYKIVSNCPKWYIMVPNDQKQFKTYQNVSKRFILVQFFFGNHKGNFRIAPATPRMLNTSLLRRLQALTDATPPIGTKIAVTFEPVLLAVLAVMQL